MQAQMTPELKRMQEAVMAHVRESLTKDLLIESFMFYLKENPVEEATYGWDDAEDVQIFPKIDFEDLEVGKDSFEVSILAESTFDETFNKGGIYIGCRFFESDDWCVQTHIMGFEDRFDAAHVDAVDWSAVRNKFLDELQAVLLSDA
jgi:hypothetical protein